MHPRHDAGPEWGPKASYSSGVYEPWVVGQVTGIRVDAATVEQIVRVLSTPNVMPSDVSRARVERMKRDLALAHAAGGLDDATYLARMATLRTELATAAEREPTHAVASADKVIATLRALPVTWAMATPDGRAELLNAIHERMVVRGPEFVSACLTPDAYAMGRARALPEHVRPAQEWAWRARQGTKRDIMVGSLAAWRTPHESKGRSNQCPS